MFKKKNIFKVIGLFHLSKEYREEEFSYFQNFKVHSNYETVLDVQN